MAQSSLYAGEKGGARIMKIGRIGFDEVVGGGDLGSHVFTGTLRSERVEVTEEIEIEGTGSHIQIEITADSNDLKGIFLIESIKAKGRVIRLASGRSGVA